MGDTSVVTVPGSWKKGRKIGEGTFGQVHMVVNLDDSSDKSLAVKEVQIEKKYRELLKREISVLQKLQHERILPLVGYEETRTSCYLFFPFMSEGSLGDYIRKKRRMAEPEVRRLTKQILEGLSYLHNMGVLHRDLKGDNVLLDSNLNIKLADFGLSKLLDDPKTYSETSYQGTPNFMAPELWRKGKHTFTVDIWALGCTVVEMITGEPPFSGRGLGSIKESQNDGQPPQYRLPAGSSRNLKDFLDQTFHHDPKKRPSADQLLKHPFLQA